MHIEIVTEPSEELYLELEELYDRHALGEFRCVADGHNPMIERRVVLKKQAFIVVGREHQNGPIWAAFFVRKDGTLTLPAVDPEHWQIMAPMGVAAQRACPVEMHATTTNVALQEAAKLTGRVSVNAEGRITWSRRP